MSQDTPAYGRGAVFVRITGDPMSFDAVIAELTRWKELSLLGDELGDALDSLIGLPDLLEKLVTVKSDWSRASGTLEVGVFLDPTDCFIRLGAAVRARDADLCRQIHRQLLAADVGRGRSG